MRDNLGFGDAAKEVKLDLPTLFTDKTETKVVTSFGSTRFLEKAASDAIQQRFFIMDTTEGLGVSMYYDRLFGSYVFLPHEPGTGVTGRPDLVNAEDFVVAIDRDLNLRTLSDLPVELADRLTALNVETLNAVSSNDFNAPENIVASDLELRLQINGSSHFEFAQPDTAGIGEPVERMGLLVARDRDGEAVGKIRVRQTGGN